MLIPFRVGLKLSLNYCPQVPFATTMTFARASMIVSLLDAFSSFGLFFVVIWFWYKISAQKVNRSFPQPLASDYSVLVRNLPSDVTETELALHFAKLYDPRVPDWTDACALPPKVIQRS